MQDISYTMVQANINIRMKILEYNNGNIKNDRPQAEQLKKIGQMPRFLGCICTPRLFVAECLCLWIKVQIQPSTLYPNIIYIVCLCFLILGLQQ